MTKMRLPLIVLIIELIKGASAGLTNKRERESLLNVKTDSNNQSFRLLSTSHFPVNFSDPSVVTDKTKEHGYESIESFATESLDRQSLPVCSGVESLFRFELTTDNIGFEISWILKMSGSKVLEGPSAATTYESNSHYIDDICLLPGKYKIIIFNKNKHGLCCNEGIGNYTGYVNGIKVISSLSNYSGAGKQIHRFTVSYPSPTTQPTSSQSLSHLQRSIPLDIASSVCYSSESKVKIEIKTDKHGSDTTWELSNTQGVVLYRNDKTYGANETDIREFCLQKGLSYNFVLRDVWGDGMCCSQGEGFYKIFLEENRSWKELLHGGTFKKKEVIEVINLKEPKMTQRDKEWLVSHNTRRRDWHTSYGKSFVPLKWSEALKQEAGRWAEKLLDSCGKGMWHDPDNALYGENVAGNSGKGSWGALKTTEDVLTRFVEREEDDQWPHNAHLTQVLWRASKYVGCAEASKSLGINGICHTQVCRYARTGNCNMNAYKVKDSNTWWLEPMLLDDSPCGPACPPDGCY